jgi:hypothetical protein
VALPPFFPLSPLVRPTYLPDRPVGATPATFAADFDDSSLISLLLACHCQPATASLAATTTHRDRPPLPATTTVTDTIAAISIAAAEAAAAAAAATSVAAYSTAFSAACFNAETARRGHTKFLAVLLDPRGTGSDWSAHVNSTFAWAEAASAETVAADKACDGHTQARQTPSTRTPGIASTPHPTDEIPLNAFHFTASWLLLGPPWEERWTAVSQQTVFLDVLNCSSSLNLNWRRRLASFKRKCAQFKYLSIENVLWEYEFSGNQIEAMQIMWSVLRDDEHVPNVQKSSPNQMVRIYRVIFTFYLACLQ